MTWKRQAPVWVWGLFGLSLGGVLWLGIFSMRTGLRLQQAGERINSLNQIQSQVLQIGSSFGWADSVIDHYTRTGLESEQLGNGLSNYRAAMAAAFLRTRNLLRLAGRNTREAQAARSLLAALQSAQRILNRSLGLMRAGNKARARKEYKTSDLANRAVYNSIAAISLDSFHDVRRLSGEVQGQGHRSRHDALWISLVALLLALTYSGVLLFYLHRRTQAMEAWQSAEIGKAVQARTLQAITRLSAGIAHDFNNLLTVILGRCELLQAAETSAKSQAMLTAVHSAGEQAAAIVGQLLALGQRQTMQAQPLDLNQQLYAIAPMLKRILGEQIELRLETQPGLPQIQADSGQLAQMLLHLAAHAADRMVTGGSLSMTTRAAHLANAQTAAELIVQDTGPEWDREVQGRIFEPFSSGIRIGRKGGMVLAAVYGIVRQTGGHIQAESSPRPLLRITFSSTAAALQDSSQILAAV